MTLTPFTPKTTGMIPFTPGQLPKVGAPAPAQDLQTRLAGGNYGEQVGSEQIAGAKKIAGSITKGAEDLQKPDVLSRIKGVAEAGLGTITGGAQIALSPITPLIEKVTKAVTPALRQQNPELAKLYDTLVPKIQDWSSKHPDGSTIASDALNTLLLAIGGGEVTKLTEAPLKEAITKEGLSSVKSDITGALSSAKSKVVEKLAPESLVTPDQKIADLIAPKPTAKEAKLAEMQGRLYKGKESTLFKGEIATKIATSDDQLQQVQTIKKLIPEAGKMDEPTLYDTMKDKINGMAVKLKPQLEKVKIKPETIKKINSDWEELKKTQVAKADASEEANVKKLQTQFETLLKKSKSGNMNDLWETAKIYDRSIDSSIKRANDMSDSKLLYKKEIWLQNRKILKDAINDSKNGLGDTSRTAFEDMTNMYGAQQGILSKAEVPTKLKGSKLSQFGSSTTGKVLKGAIGGAGVLETGKKVITGSW